MDKRKRRLQWKYGIFIEGRWLTDVKRGSPSPALDHLYPQASQFGPMCSCLYQLPNELYADRHWLLRSIYNARKFHNFESNVEKQINHFFWCHFLQWQWIWEALKKPYLFLYSMHTINFALYIRSMFPRIHIYKQHSLESTGHELWMWNSDSFWSQHPISCF